MKKKTAAIIIGAIAAAVVCVFLFVPKTEKIGGEGRPVKIGDTAPDFSAEYADEGTFTLSEAKGKVVIINFWATWCGPCCNELPAFQKLNDEYGDKLQIVAVDYGESKKEVNDFIKENGYTFPFALDKDGSVSALYPSDGIPYTVIIDKEGIIRQTFTGARSAEEQYELYKNVVEEIIDE